MLTRSLVTVALLLLAGYGATRAWPLLAGPQIRIDAPSDFATLPDGHLALSGRATHTETLWLDGAPLLIDEKGHFSASFMLPKGSAILSLTASDRFGHEITEQRSVFVP